MSPPTYPAHAAAPAGLGHDLVSHRPATLDRSFRMTDQAPGTARLSLDAFNRTLDAEAFAVLRLLVSELVANAVEHGGPDDSGRVSLRLLVFPATIAVVVEDDGPGFRDPPPVPGDDAIRGWGLHLVSELADRYGIETSPRTAVWFELDRSSSTTPSVDSAP